MKKVQMEPRPYIHKGGGPCLFPVYDPSRYFSWPHIGTCGHLEPHTHEG